jgi:hypothetical protein
MKKQIKLIKIWKEWLLITKKKVKNRNWKRIHRVCIIRIPKERQTSGEIYFLKCKSRKEIMLEATDSKWYTSW